MIKNITGIIALTVASLLAAPVLAQKSKDTIRLTILDPFDKLDSYHFPANEPGQYTRGMYGRLVLYDEHQGKFVPELAKAWRRINSTTIEYDLRDDIKFTSGNKFTGEDVKYMTQYLGNPKLKIRFKARYTWVKEVQIINPYKIRVVAKKPRPDDLMAWAYRFHIYDKGVHEKMANKALYGAKSGSSTGVYKLVSISANKGVRLIRNDEAVAKFKHRRAPIKNIVGIPIPEGQVQVAQLLTGGVDVVRSASQDTIRNLAKNPKFNVTAFSTRFLTYITLDAAGRSPNKAFKDLRVRQAFIKAIPREKIIKTFMPGADTAIRPKAICFDDNVACSYSTEPLGYDPDGAKKLLAEAGFPNGLKMELSVYAPLREVAEAVAGEIRKVGFRAKVASMPLPVYTKRRGRGELTALLARYPTFAQPNTGNLMNFFFGANRDYSKDPIIQNARKTGITILDDRERAKVYQKAVDQVNKQSYILPFVEQPNVYIHSANVEIKRGLTSNTETRMNDYFWK